MNKIKGNLSLIVSIIVIFFVGFIVYNTFIKEDTKSGMSEMKVGNMDVNTRKIIQVLEQIEDININTKFFNQTPSRDGYSLTFKQLEDFSQPIPKKRGGKVNPFVKGSGLNRATENLENNDEGIENNDESEVVNQEEIIEN